MSTHASLRRTRSRIGRLAAIALLVIALLACGRRLIRDPSFDLWCGDDLCAPWESEGRVTRVGTWHENDYGISLADNASVSQLSEEPSVECIEFEVVADVTAAAQVQLEMDFLDDGVVEFSQAIPESHWARLTFLVKAPTWYENVRFILRKQGTGRAVLAQILATSSDECEGDPIELTDRRDGVLCEEPEECRSGICASAAPLSNSTCSACSDNADCEEDEVCALEVLGNDVRRACAPLVPDEQRELGALCASGVQCGSGVCCNGLCSECCHDAETACPDDASCGHAEPQWLRVEPTICDPGASNRVQGQACVSDLDCESGDCDVDEEMCLFSRDDESAAENSWFDDCSFLHRSAGVCR